MEAVVSVNWLKDHLNDPNLVILDASVKQTVGKQTTKHPGLRIVGARHFDFKGAFADANSNLPNMACSPEVFAQGCRELGINTNSKIVVYDNLGIYSSPRVWWMFRLMGHGEVAVLDGGLPEWIGKQYPVESDETKRAIALGDFLANYSTELVRSGEAMFENLSKAKEVVLDARSHGRFTGTAPEPRAESRGGHIPDSKSLPYTEVLRDGKFLPKDELAARISQLDLGDGPLVFTCGSGITACVIMLACELVIQNAKSVYDGSWSEWGQKGSKFPVQKI